ncbi:hypothetical protein PCE1_000309 [Barthelona sp. PCE]
MSSKKFSGPVISKSTGLPSARSSKRKPRESNPTTSARRSNQKNTPRTQRKRFNEFTSSRIDVNKRSDPFSGRPKNGFEDFYESGGLHCRLQHGTRNMKLQWEIPVEQQPYFILPIITSGLRDDRHPYITIAQKAFEAFTSSEGARERIQPEIVKIVAEMRQNMSSKSMTVLRGVFTALQQLSRAVQSDLNEHLQKIIVPLTRHARNKQLNDSVMETLMVLACDDEAMGIIRRRFPTFG